ncbi:MAG TPA: plastocyanin/azurin family copper-binding protein [Chloroflexota bacterium]|nr:plastocyanin/azurin family copper-binding protein [Chloroflexota bacterium]
MAVATRRRCYPWQARLRWIGLRQFRTPARSQDFSLTFTKPGAYQYRCLIHNSIGMRGTVVVRAAVQRVAAS